MAWTCKLRSGGRGAALVRICPLGAALALAALMAVAPCSFAAGVPAQVEVRFVQPERFTDAEESARDRERALEELGGHLKRQAAKHLAEGQQLLIEVSDIDLAGQLEPVGRSAERLRVLRDVSWPRIKLHFVLKAGSEVLREGEADLSRMGYLDGVVPYFNSEPYRYEKAMLDDWLKNEFPAKR